MVFGAGSRLVYQRMIVTGDLVAAWPARAWNPTSMAMPRPGADGTTPTARARPAHRRRVCGLPWACGSARPLERGCGQLWLWPAHGPPWPAPGARVAPLAPPAQMQGAAGLHSKRFTPSFFFVCVFPEEEEDREERERRGGSG